MLLGIDHLVIAVHDPDASAAVLERDLGLAVTGGGRHEHAGTWNRLAFLGDTYLELIGVFNEAMVAASGSAAVGLAALRFLGERGEGLATWAVATDDCAADVARLRVGGSSIGPATAGSRTRPDGEIVRWLTAFPSLGPAAPPFLIEHEPAGAEWGPAARAARAAFLHPVGGRVRLAGLSIPAPDPDLAVAAFRTTSGLRFGPDRRAVIGGQLLRIADAASLPVPVVHLVGDADAPALDIERLGVRWRRRAA